MDFPLVSSARTGQMGSAANCVRGSLSALKGGAAKGSSAGVTKDHLVSLEDRYLRTISATLNTMAWSN